MLRGPDLFRAARAPVCKETHEQPDPHKTHMMMDVARDRHRRGATPKPDLAAPRAMPTWGNKAGT